MLIRAGFITRPTRPWPWGGKGRQNKILNFKQRTINKYDNTYKHKYQSDIIIIKMYQMERIESAFMVTFWSCLLERINAVSKKLQGVEIDLGTVVRLYSSLTIFFENLRDDDTAFNDFVE
jgi:hypothetical protein